MNELDMCGEFHKEMSALPLLGVRDLDKLPAKGGLYVFYEKGESCSHTPEGRRVVRVGANAQNGTLAQRIRAHYRGASPFRNHVIRAMFRASGLDKVIPEFDVKDFKARDLPRGLRNKLNAYFVDNMYFRCLVVPRASERKEFEERAIATISRCSLCKPSTDWLGNHSVNSNVRSSGLWNDEHTDSFKRLHQEDLERLSSLVQNHLRAYPMQAKKVTP